MSYNFYKPDIKRIILFFLFGLPALLIFGQAPKYSNEFLSIGVGARSLAMANSSVATINDATSTYWNPAGLVNISNSLQIGLMHNEYFAGIASYDYGAVAARIDENSSFGISVNRFGVDNIPNTLELIDNDGNIRYDRIKSFSVADYAFVASYARKSGKVENLNYGANIKLIRRIAGDFASAFGFGLDIGAQYKYDNWIFGFMGRDITSTFNFWNFNTSALEEVFIATNNEVPQNSVEITLPKLILAGARNFKINEKFSALAEINADISTDGKRNVLIKTNAISIDPHLGTELDYKHLIFLRLGMGNIQQIPDNDNVEKLKMQPSLGLGIKFNRIKLDYALTNIGDKSSAFYSNVFSLQIAIDKQNPHIY